MKRQDDSARLLYKRFLKDVYDETPSKIIIEQAKKFAGEDFAKTHPYLTNSNFIFRTPTAPLNESSQSSWNSLSDRRNNNSSSKNNPKVDSSRYDGSISVDKPPSLMSINLDNFSNRQSFSSSSDKQLSSQEMKNVNNNMSSWNYDNLNWKDSSAGRMRQKFGGSDTYDDDDYDDYSSYDNVKIESKLSYDFGDKGTSRITNNERKINVRDDASLSAVLPPQRVNDNFFADKGDTNTIIHHSSQGFSASLYNNRDLESHYKAPAQRYEQKNSVNSSSDHFGDTTENNFNSSYYNRFENSTCINKRKELVINELHSKCFVESYKNEDGKRRFNDLLIFLQSKNIAFITSAVNYLIHQQRVIRFSGSQQKRLNRVKFDKMTPQSKPNDLLEPSTLENNDQSEQLKHKDLSKNNTNLYTDLSLKLAIIPVNYPDSELDDRQISIIQIYLLHKFVPYFEGDMLQFVESYLENGAFILWCCNKGTKKWLQNSLPTIKPVDDCQLKVIEYDELNFITPQLVTHKGTDNRNAHGKSTDTKNIDVKSSDSKNSDGKRTDTKTTHGKSTDSKTTNGKSTDSKTTDGKSTDHKNTDGKSSDNKNTDSKSSDNKNTDSTSNDHKHTDGKSSDNKNTDSKSNDHKHTDGKSSDNKNIDSTSNDHKHTDGKSSDNKNIDAKSSDSKSTDKSIDNKNTDAKNNDDRSTCSKSTNSVMKKYIQFKTPKFSSDKSIDKILTVIKKQNCLDTDKWEDIDGKRIDDSLMITALIDQNEVEVIKNKSNKIFLGLTQVDVEMLAKKD